MLLLLDRKLFQDLCTQPDQIKLDETSCSESIYEKR